MKIEKLNYSRKPWRLLTDEGREVDYVCPEHGYVLPVGAETKAALIDKVLQSYEEGRRESRRLDWLLENVRGADLYFLTGWIGSDMQAARAAIDDAMKGANAEVTGGPLAARPVD